MRSVPVLPAADVQTSLDWWTGVCGFQEAFRDATPPNYVGLILDGAYVHLSAVSDAGIAAEVGAQTMVRFIVSNIDAVYAGYQQRGGTVHPNGPLATKPWGTREFSAIDPNGVCLTFQQDATSN